MFWPAPNLDGTGSPANRNVNIYWPDVVLVLLSIVRKLIDEVDSFFIIISYLNLTKNYLLVY